MKILRALVKTLLSMAFITFCAAVSAFFIAIVNPEGVAKAMEIFNLLP